MLILDTVTRQLRVVLNGATVTTPMRVVTSWRDLTSSTFAPSPTLSSTNGVTPVSIVPAPAASTQRVVDYVNIYNTDTVTRVATVSLFDGTTDFTMTSVSLAPGERLQYTDNEGWVTFNTAGALKTIATGVANPVQSGETIGVLASDVVNANATANTIADITGLSFPVVNGTRYWFRFMIRYASAVLTTGARFTVNGPTFNELAYVSRYPLTATTETFTHALAYDQPATSNATPVSLTDNLAIIQGTIRPTADGNVIARFASEIASSAVTAKAGSIVVSRAV